MKATLNVYNYMAKLHIYIYDVTCIQVASAARVAYVGNDHKCGSGGTMVKFE